MPEIDAAKQKVSEANGHYGEALGHSTAANEKRQEMGRGITDLLEQLMNMKGLLQNIVTTHTDKMALEEDTAAAAGLGFDCLDEVGVQELHSDLNGLRIKQDLLHNKITLSDLGLKDILGPNVMQRYLTNLIFSTELTLGILEAQGTKFDDYHQATRETIALGENIIQDTL